MTTVFFVRHGAHARLDRFLDGRRAGVDLDETGRAQANGVARRLARENIAAVFTSPLERTRQTAGPIAVALGLELQTSDALLEIEFGDWSGRTLEDLAPREDWQRWNAARSVSRTPAGDTMRAAQMRILDFIDQRRQSAPDDAFAIVSHSDLIKSALAYYLGSTLDALSRFAIAPASVSRVDINDWGACVMYLNETVS